MTESRHLNTPHPSAWLGLLLGLTMLPASAHEAWMIPSSTVLSSSGYITVDAAVSNDLFNFNYRPMQIRDNLFITAPDGSGVAPESLQRGALRTVFDAQLTLPGTYRLAMINSGVMASWQEGGETKRWRGSAEQLAANIPERAEALTVRENVSRIESFVTVGAPTPLQVTGHGLELAPLGHPNDLYAGETTTLGLTLNGEAAADVEVVIIAGGTRYRDQLEKSVLRTDAQGRFSHTWSTPGFHYLKASVSDQGPGSGQIERRFSYAATLEVLAP